eukprot:SAG31_NODE_2128_length_6389_cov_2.933079_3_plen_62_part_00
MLADYVETIDMLAAFVAPPPSCCRACTRPVKCMCSCLNRSWHNKLHGPRGDNGCEAWLWGD